MSIIFLYYSLCRKININSLINLHIYAATTDDEMNEVLLDSNST